MSAAFDHVLAGLEPGAALRCLVLAWRGVPHESFAVEIRARSAVFENIRDWDLDRFDITTLPQVLSWLLDSGPFSDQLERVLDRVEPFLPDPRAAGPLAALAAKPTPAQARVAEFAQRHALSPSSLEQEEALRHLRAVVIEELERDRHLAELVEEQSLERRAVLADWFMSRAEPLGEFVGLQLARSLDAEPSKREVALWEQYGVEWIGTFLGAGMVTGNGAALRAGVRFARGVPVQVEAQELIVEHARGPGWRHVKRLVLRRSSTPEERAAGDLSHAVAQVEQLDVQLGTLLDVIERTKCASLRQVTVRGAGATSWASLARLVQRLPSLQEVQFDRAGTFSALGFEATLRSLRERSMSVTLRFHEAELTIPVDGRPFLTAREQLDREWKGILEAVRAVTAQRPLLRSAAPLRPELEAHFLSRDEDG